MSIFYAIFVVLSRAPVGGELSKLAKRTVNAETANPKL